MSHKASVSSSNERAATFRALDPKHGKRAIAHFRRVAVGAQRHPIEALRVRVAGTTQRFDLSLTGS